MITEEMSRNIIKIYKMNWVTRKINRRKIKIITDSLCEQTYNHFFGIQPNCRNNIRIVINKKKSTFSNDDQAILTKFDRVMRIYDEVFSKTYSNHECKVSSFIDNELKVLVLALIEADYLDNHSHRDELRGILQ